MWVQYMRGTLDQDISMEFNCCKRLFDLVNPDVAVFGKRCSTIIFNKEYDTKLQNEY